MISGPMQNAFGTFYTFRRTNAGDTLRTWRTDPFVLLAGGPQWLPPTLPTATLAQQTAAQRGGDSKVHTRLLTCVHRSMSAVARTHHVPPLFTIYLCRDA